MKTNMGYVIAYKKSIRNKTKEYYLVNVENHIYRTDYIIDATVFDTKQQAEEQIKKLNDQRLYVKDYAITLV